MSDVSSTAPDGGLSDLTATSPAQSSALADQRWTGSRPLKAAWTVLAAIIVTPFSGVAIASAPQAAAILVPIALITLAVAACYRLWRSDVELTGDGTVIVRNLLRTSHVPVAQILSMRRSDYGIRIALIDGRNVTAGALQTGLWRRRSGRPDQAATAILAITHAIEAARSARPAETAGAIDAAAPLRASRVVRSLIVYTVAGPALLIASFFVPAAGLNLSWRLRWIGIAYTVVSFAAAYRLLRLAQPGTGKPGRHGRSR